jgi:DNA polymerase III subunit gamma/tau
MYLALARKYRPQKFEDLIGQPHITKTLQNAIAQDKLYPGLIFSGMKGVGKTSAARILSKALNCEKGPAVEPCNQCQICTEITEDKSPDYIEIDGASNNGVEEVRSLKEKVKYKPLKNRYRIVVIDEVHMLSNSAWNALLKTIEEPPDHTYFILATTDFHKIPATIVSRCQHFEFKRIPQEIIIKLLKEICAKENITINDYSLYLIARASEGGLRDAKKILDQAIALSNGDVHDKDVIDILGVIEEEIFINLTKSVLTKDRKEIIKQIHDLAERGMDLRFFYNEYLKFFRDLLVLKSLDESEKLHNLNPENIPSLKEMLKNVREIELLRYFNAAKDLEIAIKNTENPRIILEYLFLKLSYFPSLISIEEYIEKTKSGELPVMDFSVGEDTSIENSPHPYQKFDKDEPRVVNDLFEEKSDFNSMLIESIRKEQPRLASGLGAATLSIKDNTLSIVFPAGMEIAYKNTEIHKEFIKEATFRIRKQKMEVELSIDKNSSNGEDARIKELEKDPKLGGLAEKLKGKMVSIDKINKE